MEGLPELEPQLSEELEESREYFPLASLTLSLRLYAVHCAFFVLLQECANGLEI
jgi:hypothetical protein